MSFSDSAAVGTSNPRAPAQDTQKLISLLDSLMPLLLRIQSQPTEQQYPFAPTSSLFDNPLIDQQAATSLVEDITADSLRTLSSYLETYAERFAGLRSCVAIVTQAERQFNARDYAQAFNLIWQAYRIITALRAANPQLPTPRTVTLSAASDPAKQAH
jgi:hypothetical protein